LYIVIIIKQTFNDKNFFIASMEDENQTGKNTSGLLESITHTKQKNKHERMNNSRKNRSLNRKYSER